MKNCFLLLCISFLFFYSVSAQLSITGKHISLQMKNGSQTIDVIIFDSISNATQIEYAGVNVRFYKFNETGFETALFPPDDTTGYVIENDGIIVDTIWVIDYNKHLPVYNSLSPSNNSSEQCKKTTLNLQAIIPPLFFKNPSGNRFELSRKFKIDYQTLSWESNAWVSQDVIEEINDPGTNIEIPASLKDTKYTLTDDFATQLGLSSSSFQSELYPAIAVACRPTTEVVLRDYLNESERPSEASQITGSAPLDILFKANASDAVKYYNWEIRKDSILLAIRAEKDQRYSFTEAGVYNVRLIASNDFCLDTAFVNITVSESAIYAPNVFTPNGDGKNDEFRVAFKSIIQFECWIYNRWGRKMYSWTNPLKGWDGTYNGKKMPEGPYFYVIRAVGSDKVVHKLKGSVSLLRGRDN